MDYIQQIADITTVILSDELNYQSLKRALETYKSMLLDLSKLDLDDRDNRTDLQFENGIALGTTMAAMCVDDIMRTRQFIRGVFEAVEDVKQTKDADPVRILYAGSGPFAALLLPLTAKYTCREVQFILLEVNKRTLSSLNRVIKGLGIAAYIQELVCANAATYRIPQNAEIDILLSETMQVGLVKEQQVPIMLNLVSQLPEDIIILPEAVNLELGSRMQLPATSSNGDVSPYRILDTLLQFDKKHIRSYLDESQALESKSEFVLCEQLNFKEKIEATDDQLSVLTSIQVYRDNWIKIYDSSLTIPKDLLDLRNVEEGLNYISITYTFAGNPRFEFELS